MPHEPITREGLDALSDEAFLARYEIEHEHEIQAALQLLKDVEHGDMSARAGSCLVCGRVTTLIAAWRRLGNGLCWTCWVRGWDIAPR